jgi:hypothetical protein
MAHDSYQLTAQDIKALRTCDDVLYRYNRAGSVSCIEAIKRKSPSSVWEQTYDVLVTTTSTSYQDDMQVKSAFASMGNYKYSPSPLPTVLGLLHVGDTLTVHLVAANNHGYLDTAGLYCDMLYLHITRGSKVLCFLLDTSICPDNSARMCKMENRT